MQGVAPKADVTFEVELISWFKCEDLSNSKDGRVMMKTLEESGGYTPKPKDMDIVVMKHRLEKTLLTNKGVCFTPTSFHSDIHTCKCKYTCVRMTLRHAGRE
jgi:hypothetical protein